MGLEYIRQTFLTAHQLAELSGVGLDRLRAMVDAGCLPGPAYRVAGECRISSFFGDHEEKIELEYFPRSYVGKVVAFEQSGLSLDALADRERAAFCEAYAETLEALRADTFGLEALYSAGGCVGGAAAEAHLQQEWQAYLDGTYGLCTRTASPGDIATKEAMIAKVKYLIALLGENDGDAVKADLEQAIDMLDQVSAPFAPHEVARSSREKYINQPRARYLDQSA